LFIVVHIEANLLTAKQNKSLLTFTLGEGKVAAVDLKVVG